MFRPVLAGALSAAVAVVTATVPASSAAALPLTYPPTYSGAGSSLGAVVATFHNQYSSLIIGCQASTIAGARNTTTGRPLTVTSLTFPTSSSTFCTYPAGGSFTVTALGLPWTVTSSTVTGVRIRVVSKASSISCTFEMGGVGGAGTGTLSAVHSGSTFRLTGVLEVASGANCPGDFEPGDPVRVEAPFTI